MRVSVSPDYNVCAGGIHNITRQALDFCQDVCAGGQIGNANFSVAVRLKNAVLSKRGCADYAVQTHFTACGSCNAELHPRQRLSGDAVPFLHNQFSRRLVLECQGNRAALPDLNGLALGINQKSGRSFRFGDNHALARFQAGNANFSIFIGTINAVAVPDHGAVRIGDLKLSVLEGNAGIDAAYLSDKKQAVRGVVEGDGDNILNAVIGNVDGFRRFDDGITVPGVYLLNNVRSRSESGPNGGAVLPGDFLPNHSAARATCSTQETELERTAREGLMGHAVVLFHDNSVQRLILECQGFALAAVDNNALGGGFLHLEAGGGGHLSHGVLAGVHLLALLMHLDLAVGVGENIPVVNGAGSVRRLSVAGVGDAELGPLNGSARHTVLLKNGQLRGLMVLECDGFLVAGVQADRLLPVGVPAGKVIGRGHGLLRDFIGAGGQPQRNRSVRAGGPVILIVPVDSFDGKHGAGNRLAAVGVDLGNGQLRFLQILEDQLSLLAGSQVDGLHGFIPHHIGVRDGLLNDFITVHGDIGQVGLSVRPGGHVVVIAVVDALDLKDGSGNDLLGLGVPLEDGQAGQTFVRSCHGDSAAAVDDRLVNMGKHRFGQFGPGRGGRNLNKGVHPLGYVGNGDTAVFRGGLRADDLAIPDNVKHRSGERIAAVIQFDKPDFDFSVVLENQGNVRFTVPNKRLLDLTLVGTLGISFWRGRLF